MDIHESHPAHESFKQIFEASARGRELLHKVRAFSLRPAIQKKNIPLQTVVEEALQILRGIIPEKVELQARISPGCPAVHADAAQIHQLLLDLSLHCWHNLHERRGEITLALDFTHVPKKVSHLIAGENCVRLTVRDNSHGLDKHGLEKIFDPFHTREVVHAHHGEILAESESGHGLAFHIYLPVAE
jgi:nitrogen-specific signal transduction histidine kinase